MRDVRLAPPTPLGEPRPARPPRTADTVAPAPLLEQPGGLGDPARAIEQRRRWFHPRRGWFRRLERRTSHELSRCVYPWVPGIQLPYGRQLRRQLTLARAEIGLAGLGEPFDGLRVLLVTDVHAGPFVRPSALEEVAVRLAALDVDLVLIGGDIVTARAAEFTASAAAFRLLGAAAPTYAVLGNHDHYTGEPHAVAAGLAACGIEVLHNRHVVIEREGSQLCLAGIDDLIMGEPDLDLALEGTSAPVVLLSHNPDVLFEAARRDVALVLAGHTHAGQIRVPGLPVLVRQSRFRLDQGRYRLGQTELVVSRGLGVVGVPLRVACPPEAVLLTLRKSRA